MADKLDDPVTQIFDLMAGNSNPNPGRNCDQCGMHYVVVGGEYKPPYDHYCGRCSAPKG